MKSKKLALRLTGCIFGLVAILHLSRIITGARVMIGTYALPLWVSYAGLAATLFLCCWLCWLSARGSDN